MTRQEAAKLVAAIIAACPGQSHRLDAQRTASMVDAFGALLGDLEYAVCDAAVRVLLQTRPWMPSVADIRSTVGDLTRGPARPGGDAWGEVLQAVGRWGSYRNPGEDFSFQDPLVARCVAAMGWRNICLSENTVADRARFIALYDQFTEQDRRELASPQLAEARRNRELSAYPESAVLIAGVAKRLRGERQ